MKYCSFDNFVGSKIIIVMCVFFLPGQAEYSWKVLLAPKLNFLLRWLMELVDYKLWILLFAYDIYGYSLILNLLNRFINSIYGSHKTQV